MQNHSVEPVEPSPQSANATRVLIEDLVTEASEAVQASETVDAGQAQEEEIDAEDSGVIWGVAINEFPPFDPLA